MEKNCSKKALIVRLGAYGDGLIITPIIRRLKQLGYYVIANVSDRCAIVLKENPNVDEFIFHETNSVPCSELDAHWAKMKEDVKPDLFINLSESIECNLAFAPTDPRYNYTKQERLDICNINYYEETFRKANMTFRDKDDLRPEIYFSPLEIQQNIGYIRRDKFNILWCMSGSNKHKAYPWVDEVIEMVFDNNKNIHFITVGDDGCKVIEPKYGKAITNLCGEISMRGSMCLTGLVDLVVSPDTGLLHSSGCFDTPKIGLLGHTTRENITKHFANDYSIESDVACAPCFRLIYDHFLQCPIHKDTGGSYCQALGIDPIKVYNTIQKVIDERRKNG